LISPPSIRTALPVIHFAWGDTRKQYLNAGLINGLCHFFQGIAIAGGKHERGEILVPGVHRMPLWAGQSAAFARRESAGDFVRRTWVQAQEFLP
jgi:hypothetical protein